MAADLTKVLQPPSVDAPVAALFSSSPVTGPPEDNLRPEEKKSEQSLLKSHNASAWAIKASSAASFFNRASLMWLRQLQARLPSSDSRSQQDLNKIIASLEFSADATLNASRFAAKAIGATNTSRRLLWLRNWQADARNKWRLASSAYGGEKLFGDPLDPFLLEARDKRKYLPSLSRRNDNRSTPYTRPFRSNFPPLLLLPVPNVSTPPANLAFRTVSRANLAGTTRVVVIVSSPFVTTGGAPIGAPADWLPSLPIGGRLTHFFHRWEESSSDPWVLETIRSGLSLEFLSHPPTRFLRCPVSRDPAKALLVEEAIQHLLAIRAIQPVPPDQLEQGFYSRLFIVQKASGGWRAILDLKDLNRRVLYRRFKMHSLQTILGCVRMGDFMSSIDLTEAYLHVPIHRDHRQFLRFCHQNNHFQYRALPFGLSSAPRTFTKLMSALAAHLHSLPVRVQFYLDDLLIQSQSIHLAHRDLSITMQVLQEHGFSINLAKSHLRPSTRIHHLGAIIDSAQSRVFLSRDRLLSLQHLVRRVRASSSVSLLTLSKLLGKLVSCIGIVPWARLHCRALQWVLLPFQRKRVSASLIRIQVSPDLRKSLLWWLSPSVRKGRDFRDPHRIVLTTDASLHGWGAHLGDHLTQGTWSPSDLEHQINWLELRAIRLALLSFQDLVQGSDIMVLTDNTTAKAHVNRLGGTHSKSLMVEAEKLGTWAELNLRSIQAEHISGSLNTQADWLSRTAIDNSEWSIPPDVFHQISLVFGVPLVDLFATPGNRQVPRFFSRFPSPGAEGVDSLRSPWPPGLLYAFPPLPLIARVIRKIITERAEVILLAPHWPRRHWFADLKTLSVEPPWLIPSNVISLTQGSLVHPNPHWFQLTAWRLSGSN